MDALECLLTRRSAQALAEPAPDREALRTMLDAAVAAPDHGRLRPWRFIVVRGPAREGLGAAFAAAHAEQDPQADEHALERVGAKPLRAPLILVVVADPRPSEKVPAWEQIASAACAAEHVQLAAHALGYGSMWRTGPMADAPKVRAHLGVRDRERVVAFLYLGTVPEGWTPPPRPAIDPAELVTEL